MNTEFMTFLLADPARTSTRMAEAAGALKAKSVAPGDVAEAFDRKFCGDEGKRTFIDDFKAKVTASEGAK